MSVKVSALVWECFPAGGSEMLCMLAMADWSNDQGGSIHPSMARLAHKMRVSERQAQRTVKRLIQQGYLAVIGNEYGGKPGTTRQYQIDIEKLKTGDTDDTGDIHDTGDTGVARRVTPVSQTGDTHDTQSVKEPSVEPSVKKRFSDEDFEAFWTACRENWFGSPGTRKEAKAVFEKLSPAKIDLDDITRRTILECHARKRQHAAGEFVPAMKHVVRWIKYAGWEDVQAKPKGVSQDLLDLQKAVGV